MNGTYQDGLGRYPVVSIPMSETESERFRPRLVTGP